MEFIKKCEITIAGWFAQAPHMSTSGRTWLAKNIWWMALVGAIIGAVGLVITMIGTLFAGALLSTFGGFVGALVAAPLILAVLITSAVAIATVVLLFVAVSPLKKGQRRGWTLLFIAVLLQVAVEALTLILTFNIFEVVWGLLFTAIAAYFLFEIREQYGNSAARSAATKTPKKSA